MALQTPIMTLKSAASSSFATLPSLSAFAPSLSRGLRRWPQQSRAQRSASVLSSQKNTHSEGIARGQPKSNDAAQSAFTETFGGVSRDGSDFKPSTSTLSSPYGITGLIHQAPRMGRSSPLAQRFPDVSPSPRLFSSVAGSRPFTMKSPSRHLGLNVSQIRTLTAGQTSHNLLAHMESTANNNPSSASSQNAFYTALLRANMPGILVERYETGRYATNAACDAMYHRALERLGQSNAAGVETGTNNQKGLNLQQIRDVAQGVVASSRGGTQSAAGGRNAAYETGDRHNPVHVVVGESPRMTIFKVLKFVATFGLLGYLALILLSLAVETTGVFKRVGGSNNAEVKAEEQKARFDDVQGCDEAKEELQEIVDFLRSPDKYNQLGGKLPKGVLMIGPPGTGKTLLARAVAGEAGVPFFYMAGSEFDEVYVGVGAKRVRELFANAKSKAPAIVFIDEIDAVGGKRNERDAAYHMQTLNQMLTELDGFDQSAGVVFIAATNFPQMLDKALTRPGRFDRQIQVDLPDVRGRVSILKHYMKTMQISTDVDATTIARGTPGFSGADLENLVNQAAVHASKIGSNKVGMSDMEWSKDRVMMGAERKSMVIQDKDKLMTAYHEAGHALMAMFTKDASPLYKCTIMPRGHALGITYSLPELDQVSQSKSQLLAWIDKAMGGKIAEEIVYGVQNVSSGCASDLESATNTAFAMVASYGMSDRLGSIAFDSKLYRSISEETRKNIEEEVRKILDEGLERARVLLKSKRKELDLLAQALIKYETLNKEEMEAVVAGKSLPDKITSQPSAAIKLPELPLPPGIGGESQGDKPSLPEKAGN